MSNRFRPIYFIDPDKSVFYWLALPSCFTVVLTGDFLLIRIQASPASWRQQNAYEVSVYSCSNHLSARASAQPKAQQLGQVNIAHEIVDRCPGPMSRKLVQTDFMWRLTSSPLFSRNLRYLHVCAVITFCNADSSNPFCIVVSKLDV